MIKKVKNIVLWTYVITNLKGKEIVEKELQTKNNYKKQIEKSLELKKQ